MRRTLPIIPLILIVLTVLLGIVIGPVSSAIELPSALKPYALPLLLLLTIVWSIIAVWQYFLQNKSGQGTERPIHLPSRQDRKTLLSRVRSFWIDGVLEQSLHGAALLALGLRNQPDVLMNPWHLTLQQSDQVAHTLPTNTRIIQVYDQAPSGLLILGEPGSGKTTLLLELARDLVDRAERDESQRIPLVFNLSSWAVKRLLLVEWLVEEMNIKYQVPRHLGQAWMQADQTLPLLYGLDEVALPYRVACVESINAFREEYGLGSLVVCSRWADYQELKPRLLLQRAIVVQPLTEQQIDLYLSSTDKRLEEVREALRDDPVLRDLITTPLTLGVMTLAYHDRPDESLEVSGSANTLRRKLFEDYVLAMLKRRGIETHYTAQRTIVWLIYLAKQQMQHSQTEFYLERMQPEWLPDARSRILYRVVVGLFGWLIYLLGLGLIGALVGGLVGGTIVGLKKEINPTEVIAWTWPGMKKGLFVGLIVGLIFALLYGLGGGLFFWLFFGCVLGPFFGLFGGGDAFIQHFTLRWFLWRAGLIPWKYPRFLDYAVESILLRKVGGGYIFIHRLLLEYFATPVTESPSKEAAK